MIYCTGCQLVFTVKTFVFDILSLLKYFIYVQFSILSFTQICGQYPLLTDGFAFAKYFNVRNKMERLSSNCLYFFNPSKRQLHLQLFGLRSVSDSHFNSYLHTRPAKRCACALCRGTRQMAATILYRDLHFIGKLLDNIKFSYLFA